MAMNQQQAATALQQAGVSVFNLKVEDAGGTLTLRGTVASDSDKKKAEQALASGGTAIANHLQVSAGATTGGERSYTVKSGDSLSKIAKELYGDAGQWKKIHQANAAAIPDPDLIKPGQTLTIPA